MAQKLTKVAETTTLANTDTMIVVDESVQNSDGTTGALKRIKKEDTGFALASSTNSKIDTKADAIVKSASGSIASFSDGGDDLPMKSLLVNIEPKQSGSGEPSPSNVRPISGYSEVKTTRCGKNVLYLPTYEEFITCPLVGNYYSYAIKVKPNTSYYLNVSYTDGYDPSGKYVYLLLTNNASGNSPWVAVAHHSEPSGGAITSSADGYLYLRLSKGNSAYVHYPNIRSHALAQLEEGTSATAYEPYNGTTYTTSLGQTVYGGTLDVVSGVLRITHKYWTENGSGSWQYTSSGGARFYIGGVSADAKNVSTNGWSNYGKLTDAFTDNGIVVGSNGRINLCGNIASAFASVNALKTALASTPLQLVYELATPTEVTLTPTEVDTLLGQNNIWADAGTVEVEYRADTTLAYNELLSLIASLS